jgi:hypothetical protein
MDVHIRIPEWQVLPLCPGWRHMLQPVAVARVAACDRTEQSLLGAAPAMKFIDIQLSGPEIGASSLCRRGAALSILTL